MRRSPLLHSTAVAFGLALALGLGASPEACRAQDSESSFDFHGYGQLSRLHDADGPDSGNEWDYDVAALTVWHVRPDLHLWGQVSRYRYRKRTQIEWAFIDWDATSADSLRLGQARVPAGLLNEPRDVQALRNSASVPMMYEGSGSLVDEVMRGAIWEHRTSGRITMESWIGGTLTADESQPQSARVAGARVQWTSEAADWTLTASGYTGDAAGGALPGRPPRHLWMVGGRHEAGPWALSFELARSAASGALSTSAYAQADFALADAHAFFVRADDLAHGQQPGISATGRTRLAGGYAWKVGPQWGWRLEAGTNRGRGTSHDAWNDVVASIDFYL